MHRRSLVIAQPHCRVQGLSAQISGLGAPWARMPLNLTPVLAGVAVVALLFGGDVLSHYQSNEPASKPPGLAEQSLGGKLLVSYWCVVGGTRGTHTNTRSVRERERERGRERRAAFPTRRLPVCRAA